MAKNTPVENAFLRMEEELEHTIGLIYDTFSGDGGIPFGMTEGSLERLRDEFADVANESYFYMRTDLLAYKIWRNSESIGRLEIREEEDEIIDGSFSFSDSRRREKKLRMISQMEEYFLLLKEDNDEYITQNSEGDRMLSRGATRLSLFRGIEFGNGGLAFNNIYSDLSKYKGDEIKRDLAVRMLYHLISRKSFTLDALIDSEVLMDPLSSVWSGMRYLDKPLVEEDETSDNLPSVKWIKKMRRRDLRMDSALKGPSEILHDITSDKLIQSFAKVFLEMGYIPQEEGSYSEEPLYEELAVQSSYLDDIMNLE